MQISEKVARLKSDFDGVYDRGYKSGMENSENYKKGKAEAEAITRGIIDGTITELVIPDGTTKIRGYAFSWCLSLKKITIPEGVAVISGNGLATTGLTELDLPMSCETLDAWSLYNNQYLTRIRLGNVKSIGASALRGAPACMEYDFTRCSTVPTLSNTDALGSINANAKILVPAKLYYDWIEATNWAEYADYIVPDGLVASRGLEYSFNGWHYEVFGRGSCLDSVIVIPETYNDGINGERAVRRISGYETEGYENIGAFMNDQTIEEIILPESGVSIAYYAFNGSSLKVVRNYSSSDSFWSSGLALEYVSFLDGTGIENYDFSVADYVKTLDFSRHTAVPTLADLSYLNVHPDLKILVPIELYDEWINATNWTLISPYIFPMETE